MMSFNLKDWDYKPGRGADKRHAAGWLEAALKDYREAPTDENLAMLVGEAANVVGLGPTRDKECVIEGIPSYQVAIRELFATQARLYGKPEVLQRVGWFLGDAVKWLGRIVAEPRRYERKYVAEKWRAVGAAIANEVEVSQ